MERKRLLACKEDNSSKKKRRDEVIIRTNNIIELKFRLSSELSKSVSSILIKYEGKENMDEIIANLLHSVSFDRKLIAEIQESLGIRIEVSPSYDECYSVGSAKLDKSRSPPKNNEISECLTTFSSNSITAASIDDSKKCSNNIGTKLENSPSHLRRSSEKSEYVTSPTCSTAKTPKGTNDILGIKLGNPDPQPSNSITETENPSCSNFYVSAKWSNNNSVSRTAVKNLNLQHTSHPEKIKSFSIKTEKISEDCGNTLGTKFENSALPMLSPSKTSKILQPSAPTAQKTLSKCGSEIDSAVHTNCTSKKIQSSSCAKEDKKSKDCDVSETNFNTRSNSSFKKLPSSFPIADVDNISEDISGNELDHSNLHPKISCKKLQSSTTEKLPENCANLSGTKLEKSNQILDTCKELQSSSRSFTEGKTTEYCRSATENTSRNSSCKPVQCQVPSDPRSRSSVAEIMSVEDGTTSVGMDIIESNLNLTSINTKSVGDLLEEILSTAVTDSIAPLNCGTAFIELLEDESLFAKNSCLFKEINSEETGNHYSFESPPLISSLRSDLEQTKCAKQSIVDLPHHDSQIATAFVPQSDTAVFTNRSPVRIFDQIDGKLPVCGNSNSSITGGTVAATTIANNALAFPCRSGENHSAVNDNSLVTVNNNVVDVFNLNKNVVDVFNLNKNVCDSPVETNTNQSEETAAENFNEESVSEFLLSNAKPKLVSVQNVTPEDEDDIVADKQLSDDIRQPFVLLERMDPAGHLQQNGTKISPSSNVTVHQVRRCIADMKKCVLLENPDLQRIKSAMEITYSYRKKMVLDPNIGVHAVLKEFPALSLYEVVKCEGARILDNKLNLLEELLEENFVRAANSRKIKSPHKFFTDAKLVFKKTQSEETRKTAGMVCLAFYLAEKQAVGSLFQLKTKKKKIVSKLTPTMVLEEKDLLSEAGEIEIYADGAEMLKVPNFYEGVLTIYSLYYLFDIVYDKNVTLLFQYFDFLIGLPQNSFSTHEDA